ncbi:hypothetical protein [Serratia sp. D1N4]
MPETPLEKPSRTDQQIENDLPVTAKLLAVWRFISSAYVTFSANTTTMALLVSSTNR